MHVTTSLCINSPPLHTLDAIHVAVTFYMLVTGLLGWMSSMPDSPTRSTSSMHLGGDSYS